MSRNSKTLLIVMGVLVLLGGGYYGSIIWKNRKSVSVPYMPPPKIGNLDGSKLVKIEIPGMVLEKKNSLAWELVSLDGKNPPDGIDLDQGEIQNMCYSLATIYVEQVVEENPADTSIFGLDKPSSRSIITDSDGRRAVYILGNVAPSQSSCYVKQEGDITVYTISSYSAEYMKVSLDRIRHRVLFPAFEFPGLVKFRLETPVTTIDISVKPENPPPHLASGFSTHIITSPYKLPRAVYGEVLNKLLTPLNDLAIIDFIDDHPSSLSPYGLEKPIKIFLQTVTDSIDLLVGSQIDGKRYAKLTGAPGVFTLAGLEDIINAKPFDLTDKFALLINIDIVDRLRISGGEKEINADFRGSGDDAVFYLNGKEAESKSFRNFYQAVISLMTEAEYSGPPLSGETTDTGNITIEYLLNTPPGEKVSITLIPYNRDFYALKQEGTTEFLISRNQVRKIYEAEKAVKL